MTIEERAWEKYPEVIKHHNLAQIDINEEKRKMYIEIASEQKKIDDANLYECVDEIIKANTDFQEGMVKLTKQETIENAWQWMVEWVFENTPYEVLDELMSSREEYIKTMEE